jgi:X-Pro dipeptidyl-peptidase
LGERESGLIGHSYSGSVAYEVATTGVDGLKTIIPEAGPASWYGYVNSQGICIEKSKSYDYMNFIAATCTSRLAIDYGVDPSFDMVLGRFKQYRSFVRNQQVQQKGDFGPFWEEREWSTRGGWHQRVCAYRGGAQRRQRHHEADRLHARCDFVVRT